MRHELEQSNVNLLGLVRQILVLDLPDGVRGELHHQGKPSFDHLPLVQVEARYDSQKLPEMALVESPAHRLTNHELHRLEGRRPRVMPFAIDLEINLELLEKLHEMVKVVWKGQVENSLLNDMLHLCSLELAFFRC